MAQNRSAPMSVRRHPDTFCRSLIIRISRSAALLSLFRYRNNDNYPDAVVMPMSVVRSGSAAGQGGVCAA
jgi:hypothetical protein